MDEVADTFTHLSVGSHIHCYLRFHQALIPLVACDWTQSLIDRNAEFVLARWQCKSSSRTRKKSRSRKISPPSFASAHQHLNKQTTGRYQHQHVGGPRHVDLSHLLRQGMHVYTNQHQSFQKHAGLHLLACRAVNPYQTFQADLKRT